MWRDRRVEVGYDGRGDLEREVLRGPVLLGGRQHAVVRARTRRRRAPSPRPPAAPRRRAGRKTGGDVGVHQQRLGGVAHRRALGLGVEHDRERHVEVGVARRRRRGSCRPRSRSPAPSTPRRPSGSGRRRRAGSSTSTRPRARISSLTDSWPSPGTSWTTSAGSPAPSTAARSTATIAALERRALERAAQQHRVAGLEADAGGVGGDVGAGLVDDADHTERHPHLAQLEAVGERRRRGPPRRPGRAGRRRRAARRPSPRPGSASSRSRSSSASGVPASRGRGDVLGVGREDRRSRGRDQGVGHRLQGGVLVGAGGEREVVRGASAQPRVPPRRLAEDMAPSVGPGAALRTGSGVDVVEVDR